MRLNNLDNKCPQINQNMMKYPTQDQESWTFPENIHVQQKNVDIL